MTTTPAHTRPRPIVRHFRLGVKFVRSLDCFGARCLTKQLLLLDKPLARRVSLRALDRIDLVDQCRSVELTSWSVRRGWV